MIEDLVAGKQVFLQATSYVQTAIPGKAGEVYYPADVNEAYLFNPRNCYRIIMLPLTCLTGPFTPTWGFKPNLGNANYCSAGQLSPLLNDPLYRTIGVEQKSFRRGIGYVAWQGTQHNPNVARTENGVPRAGRNIGLNW